jgi:hypothetical protein
MNRAERRRRTRIKWKQRASYNIQHKKVRETPTPCSCEMCGNPRKWFKETTLQEKISLSSPSY